MKKIMIYAFSLADKERLTGIERVCREIILRLDKMIENTDIRVEYLYFEGAPHKIIKLEELKNIKPIAFKRRGIKKLNLLTKFFTLPRYVKKNNGVLANINVDYSATKNCISAIHDIRPVTKVSQDKKLFRIKYKYLVLGFAKKYAKYIFTISEFQKKAIVDYLKIKPEKVLVFVNGYEHMNNFGEDDGIFDKFPALGKKEEKKYFYTIGSIMPHKNFQWIYEVAKRHPEQTFAVAGALSGYNSAENYLKQQNIIYLGRVSDEENKSLMKHCKAFVFPSKYEGFGIPPLEALACGAPICISNATCLPEIYGDCAHYFNPDDFDVDLDKLLKEPVADSQKVLDKYSWDVAAKQWFDLLVSEAKND